MSSLEDKDNITWLGSENISQFMTAMEKILLSFIMMLFHEEPQLLYVHWHPLRTTTDVKN